MERWLDRETQWCEKRAQPQLESRPCKQQWRELAIQWSEDSELKNRWLVRQGTAQCPQSTPRQLQWSKGELEAGDFAGVLLADPEKKRMLPQDLALRDGNAKVCVVLGLRPSLGHAPPRPRRATSSPLLEYDEPAARTMSVYSQG